MEILRLTLTIQSESVDTNQPRRDNHIRSEDFFDVESFPVIRFSSTAVTYSPEGDLKSITGDLKFHGTTKPVTFNVTVVGAGQSPEGVLRAGYLATTKINRSDFGISSFQGIVGEEISITVNVETIKES